MHDLDFLVPSALVDPSLAVELLRDQALPNLSRVLAHAASVETVVLPPDASLTTWQAWVFATRAGVGIEHVNLAELWMAACGMTPSTKAGRYLAEPAHFRIAKDHLRLDDPSALAITLTEVRGLVDAIEPVLAEAGWRLDPVEPATLRHWSLVRDDGVALSGAAIERAIGDNVAAWQPRMIEGSTSVGEDAALAWRRCVNEIQMLWFGHPVNEAREAEGQPAINTLWLSGNGELRSAQPRYAAVDSGLPLLASIGIEPGAPRVLESFDALIDAERADDWSGWREQLARLDARLADVIRRQAAKAFGTLTLVLCGGDAIKVATVGPRDLAKVWRGWGRKPSLADVFSEHTAG